jgi:membrane protease YdiL (CAAX protease family)
MALLNGVDADPIAKRRVIRELIAYFVLAFVIAWGLGAGVLVFRPQFEAVFGHVGPLLTSWPYYVAVSAPTISAVLLSVLFGGVTGLKTLFSGLVRPIQFRWVLVAFLTFPAGLLIMGLAERGMTGAPHSVDITALVSAPLLWFTTARIFLDPGPWGEETGWRGFALPRLLTLFSPLTSALVLGFIWAVWHTPAFFASGLTQFGTDYGWFLVGVTCISVLMTWIYVNANRNYLVAGFIPHATNNLLGGHVYDNVRTEALVYIAIAVLIVLVFGPSLKGWRAARALATTA